MIDHPEIREVAALRQENDRLREDFSDAVDRALAAERRASRLEVRLARALGSRLLFGRLALFWGPLDGALAPRTVARGGVWSRKHAGGKR